MLESIHVYFLYDEELHTEDRLAVFEQLLYVDEYDSGGDIEDPHSWWETAIDPFTSGRFGSLFARVDLLPAADGLPELSKLLLSFEQKVFKPKVYTPEEVQAHLEDAVAFVKTAYACSVAAGHAPIYVIGGDSTQSEHLFGGDDRLRTTSDGVRSNKLQDIYWLQILPPEMIAETPNTRAELMDAPAHQVEELDDGSVLLVAYENPLERTDRHGELCRWFGISED